MHLAALGGTFASRPNTSTNIQWVWTGLMRGWCAGTMLGPGVGDPNPWGWRKIHGKSKGHSRCRSCITVCQGAACPCKPQAAPCCLAALTVRAVFHGARHHSQSRQEDTGGKGTGPARVQAAIAVLLQLLRGHVVHMLHVVLVHRCLARCDVP